MSLSTNTFPSSPLSISSFLLIFGASMLLSSVPALGSPASDLEEVHGAVMGEDNIPQALQESLVADHTELNRHKRSIRTRLCGVQLINTLRLVCLQAKRFKRSAFFEDEDEDELAPARLSAFEEEKERDDSPLYRKFKAIHTINVVPSRVRRAGISDHCCSRSCTLAELANFCG